MKPREQIIAKSDFFLWWPVLSGHVRVKRLVGGSALAKLSRAAGAHAWSEHFQGCYSRLNRKKMTTNIIPDGMTTAPHRLESC